MRYAPQKEKARPWDGGAFDEAQHSGQQTTTYGSHGNTDTVVNIRHELPIVPLAGVLPEASGSGKAQVIFFVQRRGVNLPIVCICPATATVSPRGLARWYHGVGVIVSGTGLQKRVHERVQQLMQEIPWLGSAELVEEVMTRANVLIRRADQ